MKIEKMTATFGKLKNATLELGDGLNVISAPNEYGKSTWCGFIDAMLYGVDTSERDKAGHLSAKTRFRPWDGGGMVGTMELIHEGQELTVQRTGKGSSPMKNFIAVRSGTADFIKTMSAENAGETLTGVSRQVFERTAFIRRAGIRVSQTSDLERKIADLVSSGDENTSYTESDEILRRWQRKLRYNKMGSIPATEQQLREATLEKQKLEASSEEIANLRASMGRLEKQIGLMEQDLEIHKKLEHRAEARRLEEARLGALRAKAEADRLEAAVTRNGHRMTREDLAGIREAAASVIPLKNVAQDAERALWQAEKELSDAAAMRVASPLSTKTEELVSTDIAKGRGLEERVKHLKEPRIPLWIPLVLVTLAVLGLVVTTGLLQPLFMNDLTIRPLVGFSLPGVIASLIVGGAGLVLFFLKPPKRRTAADELNELLDSYGVQSIDRLASLLSAYSGLIREEEAKRAARDSARAAYESAGAAAQEAGAKAVASLNAFMPEITSGEEVIAALNETERLIDQLTRAEFDSVAAQNIYETLLGEFDSSIEVDDSYLPAPLRSREDTLAAMARARQQLTEATRAYDLATGAQRALGDPAVIEGQIQMLTERLHAEQRRYNALTRAIETLSEANTELQTRFSPEVSRRAGAILSRLTDGRYEKLYFDKGFDAAAKETDSPETRPVLALSDGTGDEIYLSLRLALCELILNGDDPSPIILDDALANFDDARCARALELLRELGEKRQILLFSCHSREADTMEGLPGVNVVRL